MRLRRYVMGRLLQAVPLIFVVMTVNFILIHSAPGDPIHLLIGEGSASEELIEQTRAEFGLDRPVHVQFFSYVGNVLQLNLGYSLRYRQDVFDLILSRLPASLLLMGTAFILSSAAGILLGLYAGTRKDSLADRASVVLSILGYSMPVFFLGLLLLTVFSLKLGWFPAQGMYNIRNPQEGWGLVKDVAHHLVLPVLTYSAFQLALIFRVTRVKMQVVMKEDYITTARAKGVGERQVVFRHAVPNTLLPIVTVLGLNLEWLLAGSVLTETVFAWPGLGRLMFDAVSARDFPLLMGLFVVISSFVIVVNLVTDVVYRLIDPRVRFG
ncbi:MAG: ABC transporter permease [Rhodobacteraceae bacterium]|nr:ABC transporter permease [Paracoccaceae bacterium]